jgi:PAS domain S-box-containing protein
VQEYHREKAEEVFYNCIAHPNTIQQVELDKLQKDGTAKSTLWDFICLTDAKGEPLEVQCVGIDITERVKAEKALQESNQRYQLVSKATSDAIYDWDIQSGNILWSEGYYKLFGYSLSSPTQDIESWCANIHPEDNFITGDLFSVVKGNSDSWGAEYRYKKADGQYAFVVEKGTILRDEQGKAVRMVGAIQDITERKMAMQKLMKSEARHRGLIQSQTNYVIRVDLAGEYTYCNNKFQEDFSWIYPDKKIVGKNCMMSIEEYHHQRVAETSEKCIQSPDQVFQVEIDKPGKNGTTKTTLWDFIFLRASPDEPGEIQCVGIDISARVRAQKEMKFQANLLDKIGQAVIATDKEGTINYWNRAATTIYGWLPEEIKGKNIMDHVPSGASTTLALELKEALKKSETWSGELWVKQKNATEFPALITGSPVYDDEHNFKGYIAVSSDNTERKKADVKLRELNKNLRNYTRELVTANKGLEQFSFIVSHNLRSPVANIIGLADLLEEDYPLETKDQFLEELLDNVKRLDNVITDLNEILQVKVELTAKREEVDLSQLVNSIESSINRILEKEQAIIITDFSRAPVLSTVQSYLYSIFYNLISNSIKYRKPEVSPKIKIKSKIKDGRVLITFEDNGLGIDMGKKGEQVFGLYKRFHQHVEGKGMGLFMVKTQVELLGGKILLESEVNQGTVFTLVFNDINMNIEDERAEALHSSR